MTDLETVKKEISEKCDEITALQNELDELQIVEFPETMGFTLISIETNKEERLAMIEFANYVICRLSGCNEQQKIANLEHELKLYKTSDLELAKQIDHAFLANYLTCLKWTDRGDMHGKQVLTFQWLEHYKDEHREMTTLKYQIDIPVSPIYSDYDSAIVRAADELAQFLKKERKQVLVNLVLACFRSKQTNQEKP